MALPVRKTFHGRLHECALGVLSVSLLLRALAVGISLYAIIVSKTDTVVSTIDLSFVDKVWIFGTVPLGQLLNGVVYSSMCVLMPLQTTSGLLSILGVICKHKATLIVHFILQILTISLLIVYFVFVGGVLNEFYSTVKPGFVNEIQYGEDRSEIQSKLQCCGISGQSNSQAVGCVENRYNHGCWEKWSQPMHTFCSTLLSLYVFSFCLEVTNFVLTDYEYRRIRIEEDKERSFAKILPWDIWGEICFLSVNVLKRDGILEFVYRCFQVLDICFGVGLLIYGVYTYFHYPSLESPGVNFITIKYTGMNFYSMVKCVSLVLSVLGCLTLLAAVISVPFFCFQSLIGLFTTALLMISSFLLKLIFICCWLWLFITARGSIRDSLLELYKGKEYNTAWDNFVSTFGCCGIWESTDTNGYCSITCGDVFEGHLDTLALRILFLLAFSAVVEVFILVYVNLKVRKSSKKEDLNLDEEKRAPVIKGIFGYFKEFLQKIFNGSRLNLIPIFCVIITIITIVTFSCRALQLSYDRIFAHVHVTFLFSNITFETMTFTEILDELTGTYASVAALEFIVYIVLIVTYTYRSKFLTAIGVAVQVFAAATLLALISRWIYVTRQVSYDMVDKLHSNLVQNYVYPDDAYDNTRKYRALTDDVTSSWNSLMLELQCCGASSMYDFGQTEWRTASRSFSYSDAAVPSYCCKTQPSTRYTLIHDASCQNGYNSSSIYSESCNTKVLERFSSYYIPLFVIAVANVIAHIGLSVILILRYRHLRFNSKIDQEMTLLWETVMKRGLLFDLTKVTTALCSISLIAYGAVSFNNYPTFAIEDILEKMKVLDVPMDELVKLLSIAVIITGIISLIGACVGLIVAGFASPGAYCKEAGFTVFSIIMKIPLIIVWIIIHTTIKSDLVYMLEYFYSGRAYLTWWDRIKSVLGCCGLREVNDTGSCNSDVTTTCTSSIQSSFDSFTIAVLTIVPFMLSLEVDYAAGVLLVPECASVLQSNIKVRKLSKRTDDGGARGIFTHFKERLLEIKAQGNYNVVSLVCSVILVLFSISLILFGLEVMYDEYFTERDSKVLFDRLEFNGRSFYTTIKYWGVGLITVGLIEILISVIETISHFWATRVFTLVTVVIRACFLVSVSVMLAVWIDIHIEVAWNLHNKMFTDFTAYYEYNSVAINFWEDMTVRVNSFAWNALFVKFTCCGVNGYNDFSVIQWFQLNSEKMPVYCCHSTEKYSSGNINGCQVQLSSYYTTGCSSAVQKRFRNHSTITYCLFAFLMSIQGFQIAMHILRLVRLFKSQGFNFKKQKDDESDPELQNRIKSPARRTNVVHPSTQENNPRRESVISSEGQETKLKRRRDSVISNQRRGSEHNARRESVPSNQRRGSEQNARRESVTSNQRRGSIAKRKLSVGRRKSVEDDLDQQIAEIEQEMDI